MFDFIDRVEGEAARTAFQKVLAQGKARGLGALTADEKELVLRWKNKSELQSQRRADEASRQLGLYASLYASDRPRPSETARSFPIRTTCPKFSPASDPIGSLETWLAGVQNFISLQRVTDIVDQKRVLFSSIDINAQFHLGKKLLPNSSFVQELTYEEYVEQVRLIFSPPKEFILWKTDHRNFRQAR